MNFVTDLEKYKNEELDVIVICDINKKQTGFSRKLKKDLLEKTYEAKIKTKSIYKLGKTLRKKEILKLRESIIDLYENNSNTIDDSTIVSLIISKDNKLSFINII